MERLGKFASDVLTGIREWFGDCIRHHKLRMAAGVVIMAVELFLFLGTDVLLEDKTNYLTGEGSWEQEQNSETSGFCQVFVPEERRLRMISFLMGKDGVTVQDGQVRVIISDEENAVLFEESRSFAEISNGFFTDVEMDLQLSTRKTYYLTLVTSPSSLGEYPTVGVCGMEYVLPENRNLIQGDELPGVQLVARYHYTDVLPSDKAGKVILICVLMAFAIMFGLPENAVLRRIVGVLLLLAGPYVLGQRLELLTYKELLYLPFAMKWNVAIMYGLEFIVLLCTWSPVFTVVFTNVALTLLYSANYFMILYRNTPLRMNDFTAIGTAVNVAGEYRFVPNDHMAVAWGLLLLIVAFALQTGVRRRERGEESRKKRAVKACIKYGVSVGAAVLLAFAGKYYLCDLDTLTEAGFAYEEFKGFHQDLIFYMDGYLVATLLEARDAKIVPPEDYTTELVEELLAEAAENAPAPGEELPHIIVVMNESLADLSILEDVELNQDNLPFMRSLKENTISGYANASVLGGGTANTEFELFTGCSMAFLQTGYYPYQQAIRHDIPSAVSRLKQNGYTTISMHPEYATNWKRDKVYQYYGFDRSLWKPDFAGAEEIHSGVSDAETYRRVIELYENRQPDEKLFIFDLTMQNHGGYIAKKDQEYEVRAEGLQNSELDVYLSLVKVSDEAFSELIAYFEEEEEKVIILMFGDHQPSIRGVTTYLEEAGKNPGPLERMLLYKTPFVIWANYDIEEAEGYDISMNYLGGLLMETAGMELSPYFAYLRNLRQEYPVITVNGYVDKDGNYKNWGSAGDEFPEYRMLQYNYLFDKHRVEWGY